MRAAYIETTSTVNGSPPRTSLWEYSNTELQQQLHYYFKQNVAHSIIAESTDKQSLSESVLESQFVVFV